MTNCAFTYTHTNTITHDVHTFQHMHKHHVYSMAALISERDTLKESLSKAEANLSKLSAPPPPLPLPAPSPAKSVSDPAKSVSDPAKTERQPDSATSEALGVESSISASVKAGAKVDPVTTDSKTEISKVDKAPAVCACM